MHPQAPPSPPQPPAGATSGFFQAPNRQHVMILATLAAVAFIALGTLILPGRAAVLLLDYPSTKFPYPLTIQNMMHILFFIGLGELFVRWRAGVHEASLLKRRFLPEDEETVLRSRDLAPIRRAVASEFDGERGYLASLINLSVLQFQSSGSTDQTASIMNSHLEMIANRVELRYGMVRFLAWMVPTLGFIGTVYSLGASLSDAGQSTGDLDIKQVARTLGVGFDTTMVALVQSAILVFVMQLVQEQEEAAVNSAGDYTLRNLINRLYEG